MASPSWLTPNEEQAWRSLQFMQMRIEAAMARDLAAHTDLSYPEYLVLVALTDHAPSKVRLTELAETLGWEKSRLSHLVSRMEGRGLVERASVPSDRRGCFVVLTKQGSTAIAAAAPVHVASVRRLFFDQLSPNQVEAVGDAAATVLAAMLREG